VGIQERRPEMKIRLMYVFVIAGAMLLALINGGLGSSPG
jgi:hypothetical protein